MANLNFNAATVEPDTGFTLIPAGVYTAQITDSKVYPTKANTGTILELTFQILEGQQHNRLVWARINIQNANPKAEEIGKRQLSSICHAVGLLQLQDSTQLHGKPMKIRVKITKDDQYGDKNEINGFEALGNNSSTHAPVTKAPPSVPSAPPANASNGYAAQKQGSATPPWASR